MRYINKLIQKIFVFLAFRLPMIYRLALRFRSWDIPLNKQQSDTVVLMMTGKNLIGMTVISLASIAKNWGRLPRVIINSDGTLTVKQIQNSVRFWPGELSIEGWEDTKDFHKHKNRTALLNYGDAHPFGKKLAAILHHASAQPVLWIDSDILFFDDFTPFLPEPAANFMCGGSEDFIAAYDKRVIDLTGINLYSLYAFNAGMLYVSGDHIYEDFKLEQLLRKLHPVYDFCTEQSIFAYISSNSLGLIWPRSVLCSFNSDAQSVYPMVKVNKIARHYTSNVRHLFWRDAFYS